MTVMDIPSASLYEEAPQADRIEVGPVNIEPVQLSVIHELPQIRQEYDQSGLEELARSIVLNPGALEQHVKNGDYEAASQALDLSHPLILNRLDESHIDQYLADHAKYYDLDTKWRIAAGDNTSVLVLVSGHRRRRALELIAKQYDFALDRLYVRSTIHDNLPLHEAQRKQYTENISERPPVVDEAKIISNFYRVEQESGNNPTYKDVAEQFGCSDSKVRSAIAFDALPASIRAYVTDDTGGRVALPFSLVARMGALSELYGEKYKMCPQELKEKQTCERYVEDSLIIIANKLAQMKLNNRRATDLESCLTVEIDTARGSLALQTEELFVLDDSPAVRRKRSSSVLAHTAVNLLQLLGDQHAMTPEVADKVLALAERAKQFATPAREAQQDFLL